MTKKKNEKGKEQKLTTIQKRRLFLKAYSELGTIMRAAPQAGVTRKTIYNWRDNNEDFAIAFAAVRDEQDDRAYELIFRAINKGDIEAAKWLLTKPGRLFHDNRRHLELSGQLSVEQKAHIHELEELGRFLSRHMADTQLRSDLFAQQEASEQ